MNLLNLEMASSYLLFCFIFKMKKKDTTTKRQKHTRNQTEWKLLLELLRGCTTSHFLWLCQVILSPTVVMSFFPNSHECCVGLTEAPGWVKDRAAQCVFPGRLKFPAGPLEPTERVEAFERGSLRESQSADGSCFLPWGERARSLLRFLVGAGSGGLGGGNPSR